MARGRHVFQPLNPVPPDTLEKKKYKKGKLHFRSFLNVKIYIGNLFVLQETLTFPFHTELTDLKLLNSTLPASLGT